MRAYQRCMLMYWSLGNCTWNACISHVAGMKHARLALLVPIWTYMEIPGPLNLLRRLFVGHSATCICRDDPLGCSRIMGERGQCPPIGR